MDRGETVGTVGGSGRGNNVTSLSIIPLVPSPPGRIVDGDMVFEGQSILKKTEAEMRSARGNDISMILQEPMTSLNPVSTVGDQVMEATVIHENASTKKARQKTAEMLRSVNSPHLID